MPPRGFELFPEPPPTPYRADVQRLPDLILAQGEPVLPPAAGLSGLEAGLDPGGRSHAARRLDDPLWLEHDDREPQQRPVAGGAARRRREGGSGAAISSTTRASPTGSCATCTSRCSTPATSTSMPSGIPQAASPRSEPGFIAVAGGEYRGFLNREKMPLSILQNDIANPPDGPS